MCEYMCFTVVNSSVMSMRMCENKLAAVPAPWSLKKKKKNQQYFPQAVLFGRWKVGGSGSKGVFDLGW